MKNETTISDKAAAVKPLPSRLNDTEDDLAELCNEQAAEITRLQCERIEARKRASRLATALRECVTPGLTETVIGCCDRLSEINRIAHTALAESEGDK